MATWNDRLQTNISMINKFIVTLRQNESNLIHEKVFEAKNRVVQTMYF